MHTHTYTHILVEIEVVVVIIEGGRDEEDKGDSKEEDEGGSEDGDRGSKNDDEGGSEEDDDGVIIGVGGHAKEAANYNKSQHYKETFLIDGHLHTSTERTGIALVENLNIYQVQFLLGMDNYYFVFLH